MTGGQGNDAATRGPLTPLQIPANSHIIIPSFNLKLDGKVIAPWKPAGASGQVFEDFSLSETGHS